MILEHLPHLATKTIVLASASPRRLELLQLVGIKPRVVTSTFDETLPKSGFRNGAEYAVATSKGKALEVAERLIHNQEFADLIIGADTVSACLQLLLSGQMDDCSGCLQHRWLSLTETFWKSQMMLVMQHLCSVGQFAHAIML